ncbi:hypothetical protein O9992_29435 [Vibrio lentus]|nr:hypothetical protein [Vibrio lentus]
MPTDKRLRSIGTTFDSKTEYQPCSIFKSSAAQGLDLASGCLHTRSYIQQDMAMPVHQQEWNIHATNSKFNSLKKGLI